MRFLSISLLTARIHLRYCRPVREPPMTDETPTGQRQAPTSRLHGEAPPPVLPAGQLRLDEIGRALGHMRRRLDPGCAQAETRAVQVAARFQCPTCGHERWTATGCAVCALFGSDR